MSQNDLAGAIALVNDLRAFHSLPAISGQWETDLLADADLVRAMLIEERRRELFAEGGRYYSTKIQNTDLVWFPRAEGSTPETGYNLQGGVRLLFGADEYEGNEYWVARGGLTARGTGCDVGEAPYIG